MKHKEIHEATARNAANYGAALTPYDSDADVNQMVFARYKCTPGSLQKEIDHVKACKTDLIKRAIELAERRKKATAEAWASLEDSVTRPGVVMAIALTGGIVGLAANLKGPKDWAVMGLAAALASLVAKPGYHLGWCVVARAPQPLIAMREYGLEWRTRRLESRKQQVESYVEVQKARLNAIYKSCVGLASSLFPADATASGANGFSKLTGPAGTAASAF